MNISKYKHLLPQRFRINFVNYLIKRKYDVIFENGATAGRNTIFEGKNVLKVNAQLYDSYIGLGSYISGNSKLNKACIGRFCSIGQNVVNAFGIHPTDWISTHPAFYSTQKQAGFTFSRTQLFDEHKFVDLDRKYLVKIGNDVWIGNDVKILDGIKIGDGAIIATGSIVTKDVKPYSIVGGIPARLIRYRFCMEDIEYLLNFKWWNKDINWLKDNSKYFNNIELFINRIK